MIESIQLAAAQGIYKLSGTAPYKITYLSIELEHNEDMRSYCCVDGLNPGYEVGVYSDADDSAIDAVLVPYRIIANLMVWYLNMAHHSIEVPEGAYFGVKILEDMKGLEDHELIIERED